MSDAYTVVAASVRHIKPLSMALRAGACATLRDFGADPRQALRRAYVDSFYCRTALIGGVPVAMWGAQGSLLSDHAVVWLALGHDAARHPLAVVRAARRELALMCATRDNLHAVISQDDAGALVFAESLGFRRNRGLGSAPGTLAVSFFGGDAGHSLPARFEPVVRRRIAAGVKLP